MSFAALKKFRFRGGIHPEENKSASEGNAIESLPLAPKLYVPVQQHIGKPAEVEVEVGSYVQKGQLLAHQQGFISAPVHAPSSGTVVAVDKFPAPHPSGLPVKMVVIETDGKEQWIDRIPVADPFALEAADIANRVALAGIVGMGGATFPAAVKLKASERSAINTLIMNGAECEPYLTCDDRLMQERADEVVGGARLMQKALGANKVVFVIERNKPTAIAAMELASQTFPDISIAAVPTRYPMGSEKQMIQAATGEEVPAGGLGADIGVMVHNVGTAYAVWRALKHGEPSISRVVTVTGGAVNSAHNYEVPVGTPVSYLLEAAGGTAEETDRLLMGGPMMGQVMPNPDIPVVKGLNGIVALSPAEVRPDSSTACIRCGRCVSACPIGLMPLEMASRARQDDLKGALSFGLVDCIACGSCAWVCPSHIPLVHYFNYAKGVLAERDRAEHKARETRKLAGIKTERLERIKREKEEEAARKKAEREAKKKAREAAKAAKEAAADNKDNPPEAQAS